MRYGRIETLRQVYPVAVLCRLLDVSESVRLRLVPARRHDWEWKSGHATSTPAKPVAQRVCRPNYRITASRPASTAASGFARRWDCVAGRRRNTRQLVTQALFRAVTTKRPDKGLIHHSDRGSQYCPHDYQKLLDQFGMSPSMNRKG